MCFFLADGLVIFVTSDHRSITSLFVKEVSSTGPTDMLLQSSRTCGKLDADTPTPTERTEKISVQIEMRTNAERSMLV